MSQEQFQRDGLKFPKIAYKSKSVPASVKRVDTLSSITAKSWLYFSASTQYGVKSGIKRQIASLTKIMTAICTIQVCQKFNMNLKTTYFKVTGWACSTIGTTAELQQNCWMTVEDLLYGLMLPSGNDAACVLSQNVGAVLYFEKTGNKSLIQCNFPSIQIEIRSIDLTQDYESVKFYTQQFINCMNLKARTLKMTKTRFANPHGLDHINNYSTCDDLLMLCKTALQCPLFRKITAAATHKGTFKFYRQGKVQNKYIFWSNTNKLLQKKEVFGIKTGITNRAGGCLATAFRQDSKEEAIIIVLGSTSSETRFHDTLRIMNWIEDEEFTSTH